MRLLGLGLTLFVGAAALCAFERPSADERNRALGDLTEESAEFHRLLEPNDDFFPLSLPGPNDWLALHKETGQTFEEYRNAPSVQPDATRHIIYLLPMGEFPEDAAPPLEEVRAYASVFFQMEVKILPAYYPHDLEFDPRENQGTGKKQLLTKSILTFLPTRLPPDGFCLLGVTMTDLYPRASWRFVFGEASLSERVGIFSFARDDPAFWGGKRSRDFIDLMLRRSCKTLVHETAHMFGFRHCIYYDCVVNGANHLIEADLRPQNLCPICLRKLHLAIGFDPAKRYAALAEFYHRHKWYEEYDWVNRQLARGRSAASPLNSPSDTK